MNVKVESKIRLCHQREPGYQEKYTDLQPCLLLIVFPPTEAELRYLGITDFCSVYLIVASGVLYVAAEDYP